MNDTQMTIALSVPAEIPATSLAGYNNERQIIYLHGNRQALQIFNIHVQELDRGHEERIIFPVFPTRGPHDTSGDVWHVEIEDGRQITLQMQPGEGLKLPTWYYQVDVVEPEYPSKDDLPTVVWEVPDVVRKPWFEHQDYVRLASLNLKGQITCIAAFINTIRYYVELSQGHGGIILPELPHPDTLNNQRVITGPNATIRVITMGDDPDNKRYGYSVKVIS